MKSKLFIFFGIIYILCILVAGYASGLFSKWDDFHSFVELNQMVLNDTGIDLNHDYRYDNNPVTLYNDEPIIMNGNGHVLEGITKKDAFTISDSEVIINNVTFRNCLNSTIDILTSNVTFNNVDFIDCSSISETSMFIESYDSNITFNNCTFRSEVNEFSDVFTSGGKLVFNNCSFSGKNLANNSRILCYRGELVVVNATFADISSKFASAINYNCRT